MTTAQATVAAQHVLARLVADGNRTPEEKWGDEISDAHLIETLADVLKDEPGDPPPP